MDDRSMETIVFESLGEASACWIPSAGDAVFDSTRAEAIGNRLLSEIRDRIVGDHTEELVAERDRLREAARHLVAAAKTWTTVHQELTPPEVRQRAVDALADAIDAFDPMLSETTLTDTQRHRRRVGRIVLDADRNALADAFDENDRLRAVVAALEYKQEHAVLATRAADAAAEAVGAMAAKLSATLAERDRLQAAMETVAGTIERARRNDMQDMSGTRFAKFFDTIATAVRDARPDGTGASVDG